MQHPKYALPAAALLLSALGGYYAGYQSGASQVETVAAPATSHPSATIKSQKTVNFDAQPDDPGLVARFTDLERQLASLKKKYQRLQQKAELDAGEREELQALPELVMASIDQVPMEFIAPSIERYTNIPAEVLEQMPDQRAFVNRLAEVAMDGIVDEPDADAEPKFGPVDFSRNAGYASPQEVFTTSDLVVFAEFDSYHFARTEVLVKWYRESDGRVMLFKQMPVRAHERNYVWLNDSDGLEPGKYKVEIYEVSQEMPLLSSGRYRVEQVS